MKKGHSKFILFFIVFSFTTRLAVAQCNDENTFTGFTNQEWNEPSNWSAGCVPQSPVSGHIIIDSDCINLSEDLVFDSTSIFEIKTGVIFTNSILTWSMEGLVINDGSFIQANLVNDGNEVGTGTHIGNLTLNGEINPGAYLIPCEDSFEYAGQVYQTVRIGRQCWMAENLNVGMFVSGFTTPSDNNIIEKVCYNDNEVNCSIFGGLYKWDEMMQYSESEFSQGICPDGWHLPSDEEYKILELELGMSQSQADSTGFRGVNQGSKLAGNDEIWSSNSILAQDSTFNMSGFTALPNGFRNHTENYFYFFYEGLYTGFWTWTASESSSELATYRAISQFQTKVRRQNIHKDSALGVRCIKD